MTKRSKFRFLAIVKTSLILAVLSAASLGLAAEPFKVYAPSPSSNSLWIIDATPTDSGMTLDLSEKIDLANPVRSICAHPEKPIVYLSPAVSADAKGAAVFLDEAGRYARHVETPIIHGLGYASLDRTNQFLLGSNYREGTVDVYRLQPDGVIGAHVFGLNEGRKNAHCALLSPNNRFLYIPYVKDTNALFQYAFDEETGAIRSLISDPVIDALVVSLSDHQQSVGFNELFEVVYKNLEARNAVNHTKEMLRLRAYEKLQNLVTRGLVEKNGKLYRGSDHITEASTQPKNANPPEGTGPRHIAYHPKLPIVYFSNEQQVGVSAYDMNERGHLVLREVVDLVGAEIPETSRSASDILITPDGKFVLTGIRGKDTFNYIARYQVAEDGSLTGLGVTPADAIPWGLTLSPDGDYLLVAASDGQTLTAYAIGEDGDLETLASYDWGEKITDLVTR